MKFAILYGADAVYLAGTMFGMRTASDNFTREELIEAVKYAHEHGVKVYVTVNVLPHEDEIHLLPDYLKFLENEAKPALGMDNLARIIELWTKIPASSIREDEFERLAKLDERLKAHIVGQDEAVEAVCAAIKRSRVGLKVKRKPVSFIFVGGTGVGKTELVKRLAADMFDSPESLIRLDMSEFMEKFSVSRIIGSPPGYVGYDEAGQLTHDRRFQHIELAGCGIVRDISRHSSESSARRTS